MRHLLIFLVLAGCAASEVKLSPQVERAYAAFLAEPSGASFAVSEDGLVYGYSVCEFDVCWGNSDRVAVRSCEERSGLKCVIFD